MYAYITEIGNWTSFLLWNDGSICSKLILHWIFVLDYSSPPMLILMMRWTMSWVLLGWRGVE